MRLSPIMIMVLLVGNLSVLAQIDISGSVKDSAGGAISGATIRFSAVGNTAVTDGAGAYAVKGAPVGTLSLAGVNRFALPTLSGKRLSFFVKHSNGVEPMIR